MLIKLLAACLILIALFAAGSYGVKKFFSSGEFRQTIANEVVKKLPAKFSEGNFLTYFLGFEKPQTFLILFLNNTEIRPGGGFIGAYAVVSMNDGLPKILKVEGTEILDNSANKEILPTPPKPIAEYLGVKKWGFRDSNWSPDFIESSKKSLELYKLENGVAADEITAVIGITPTFIEEILALSGPITVGGIKYDAKNFTEKLEYEVEYGYAKKGADFAERKKALSDLTGAFVAKMPLEILKNWSEYFSLIERMFVEKQLVFYSIDSEKENILKTKGWAGEIKNTSGDYLLWVDANMGALKTDASLKRELSYTLTHEKSGKILATVKMKYEHKGMFDWRTSRYLDYARIFVPVGSEFVKVEGPIKRNAGSALFDSGIEKGKQWFGTFISIEPGDTKELIWKYYLPEEVNDKIKVGVYTLFIQKQIGAGNYKLTLDLNFDKNILSSSPDKTSEKRNDSRYELSSDLSVDREVVIKVQNN